MDRAEILAKLPKLASAKLATERDWDLLIDEEEVAYQALEERFGPRRLELEERDAEIEFLAKVQIVDGYPIYMDEQEFVSTYKSAGAAGRAERTAMFNAARGHTTVSVTTLESPFRYFRLDGEDLDLAREAAAQWVAKGQYPAWVEVSAKDLASPVETVPDL